MSTDRTRRAKRPWNPTRTLVVVLVAALGAAALPAMGSQHDDPGAAPPQRFAGSYALGPAWMAPPAVDAPVGAVVPSAAPQRVFGLILCPLNVLGSTPLPEPVVGGACNTALAHDGDWFFVRTEDASRQGVPFAVCVDANWNGICRPDTLGQDEPDFIHFHDPAASPQGEGDASFAVFQYRGVTAPASVFMMTQSDPASGLRGTSAATSGRLELHVVAEWDIERKLIRRAECSDGKDNNGDGLFDWPLDPECKAQNDDSERTPQCRDGKDNDGNLSQDHPSDPGCSSADQWVERTGYQH